MNQSIAPEASAFYMSNFWKIVLMALMAVVLLDSPKKIYIMLWVMILAQGYSAFRINEQYFQDGFSMYANRPWGTKGDNNLYTIMTVPIAGCSAAIALFATGWWMRGIAGGIFLLQIHQIMLMESRGGMLATVGMMGIVAVKMPRNRYTLSAAGLGVAAAMVLAGPPVVKEFMSSFESTEDRDGSAESRFKLWKAGAAITLDHPLLGVGPYAGSRLVPKYYEGGLKTENKGLHNLLFEISTGCGIPAAILYFSFFGIAWFAALSLSKTLVFDGEEGIWIGTAILAVVAGLPGYLAASMFSSGAMLESSYLLGSVGLATWIVANRMAVEPALTDFGDQPATETLDA
ncbi:O-antigen ligase family protein [Rosistilla ulvae]|nr:O-antigen ligase family protein [Rosistilla ulvae]